jgi:hypothetical protein
MLGESLVLKTNKKVMTVLLATPCCHFGFNPNPGKCSPPMECQLLRTHPIKQILCELLISSSPMTFEVDAGKLLIVIGNEKPVMVS